MSAKKGFNMDLGQRIDFHTHSLLSDGLLIPSELIRQAEIAGYAAIGITDHVDASNLEKTIEQMQKLLSKQKFPIIVIPGVELSYVHPENIPDLAKEAKKLGTKLVVVHGESEAFDEPVYPGTNQISVSLKGYVDILAHPGKITETEAAEAAKNDIYLELSAKKAHSTSNIHIAKMAKKTGAKMLVNTDAHKPGDLLDQKGALKIAKAAGLNDKEAITVVVDNAQELLKKLT
ncbi:histidinol phosphate phosphatase domain-containing protein [Candidatus Margulisiibacteriota bacterium]